MNKLTKTPSVTETLKVSRYYDNCHERDVEFELDIELTYHWNLEIDFIPYPNIEKIKINGIEMPFVDSFPKLEFVLNEEIVKEILDKLEIYANYNYFGFDGYESAKDEIKGFQIYNGHFIHPYDENIGFIPIEGNDALMTEIEMDIKS